MVTKVLLLFIIEAISCFQQGIEIYTDMVCQQSPLFYFF